jgi:hypothetical protein
MDAARLQRSPAAAGITRLLQHCDALTRVTGPERTASSRLQTALGADLALRLVAALSGDAAACPRSAEGESTPPVLLAAEEQYEEEDPDRGDEAEKKRRPASHVDRKEAEPDEEAEREGPEKGREAVAERGGP